ncbi:hypothetical protein ASPBRDRAFT_422116 [Aspergillus brasiliensis CBS 101740]|uniref:Uncharacterized protein n=1 Tax=Aspergillus brasiliensis (strain CBS 101740 / IMI 381727 / IBT 21946) TaxID=767769 RepID=A0A1L9U4I6_ASPBC|nr:hypothetical protein ASPBRDRAFT_422116 [Aspergillus brasiliensis CBS 101740]
MGRGFKLLRMGLCVMKIVNGLQVPGAVVTSSSFRTISSIYSSNGKQNKTKKQKAKKKHYSKSKSGVRCSFMESLGWIQPSCFDNSSLPGKAINLIGCGCFVQLIHTVQRLGRRKMKYCHP